MKKFGILLALTLLTTFAFAQNGNGNGNGNNNAHVASIKISQGFGDLEVIELKMVRPAQNEISSIGVEIPGTRYAYLPMAKTSTEYSNSPGNSGNNANDTWVLSFDLDPFTDTEGNVTLVFRTSCCHPMIIRSLPLGSR
jgi:hypothetical protein